MSDKKTKTKKESKLAQWIQDYGKYVGAGLVAIALVVVCGISLADRITNREVATGVMMTIADTGGKD